MRSLAAYLGPDIRLDQFILPPSQPLICQAGRPTDIPDEEVCAVGYGIGWYAADDAPAVYVADRPMITDRNLFNLARSLYGDLWIATMRDSVRPERAFTIDSQPLCDDQLVFAHDGQLVCPSGVQRTIRDFLDPRIESSIAGNSDSELLFALLRHLMVDDADVSFEEVITDLFGLLEDWLTGGQAQLNFVISDGESLFATRHAIAAGCPPLYYTVDDEAFPEAQLIASRRLTDSEFWQPVPEHHLLVLSPTDPPELLAL